MADRALLLRRWGRRSETALFGSRKGAGDRFFSMIGEDLEYDDLFIFDEVGWNFEPSELSAAFGLVQLDKLADNLARRRRNFELTAGAFGRHRRLFALPRTTDGVDTGWHMFPVLVRPDSGIRRGDLQQWMEGHGDRHPHGVDRATSPANRPSPGSPTGSPPGGLPHADRVMEQGLVLPNSHSLDDDDCAWIADVPRRLRGRPRPRVTDPTGARGREPAPRPGQGRGPADVRLVQVGHRAHPEEPQGPVDVLAEQLQDPRHPGLAGRAQPVGPGPPEHDGPGPQGQGPDHVRPRPDAPVDQHLGTSAPTASTTSGRARRVAGAPSSWRPPWLETTTASAPASTARRASSADEDALDHHRAVEHLPDPGQVRPGGRLADPAEQGVGGRRRARGSTGGRWRGPDRD